MAYFALADHIGRTVKFEPRKFVTSDVYLRAQGPGSPLFFLGFPLQCRLLEPSFLTFLLPEGAWRSLIRGSWDSALVTASRISRAQFSLGLTQKPGERRGRAGNKRKGRRTLDPETYLIFIIFTT